jgi:hypothetical protein
MADLWPILCAAMAGISLMLGFGMWFVWDEGYRAGKSKAIRDGLGIDRARFAAALARIMDVQADGGDSPADYVRWAITEAKRECQQGDTNGR